MQVVLVTWPIRSCSSYELVVIIQFVFHQKKQDIRAANSYALSVSLSL